MKLAALAAAALLVPPVAAAPPRAPQIVTVAVGHDRATGFVAGDERVVTVAHVLGGDDDDVVPAAGGGEIAVDGRPARIVRLDRRLDLAVLAVAGLHGDTPRLGGGGPTTLLGRPAPVVRRISARLDGGIRRPALELRAHVTIGESGAPLLTDTGRVAGILFARSRERPQTAYAVDGQVLNDLLR
jgi:S1-C subfamily serine protease